MISRSLRAAALVAAALIVTGVLFPRTTRAQQPTRPDTLDGRVTTDSGRVISDGEIIVTRGPDRTVFRARTDSAGHWRIISDPGTGDYLVYVTAPGRTPVRKRVTRTASETQFTVDITLAPAVAATLAQVEVRATKRERVERMGDLEPNRGGADRELDEITSAINPALSGSIAAAAATMPGFRQDGGGISVLGLPGSQSLTTLNGMAFGGGELPRGMFTQARMATTAYDVARGGFSGGQTDVSMFGGGIFQTHRATITSDAPFLQATDATGRALGARFTRLDANLSMAGPLDINDRFGYSGAARVRYRENDVPSLLSGRALALTAAGVSPDSAARLVSTLNSLGIPLGRASGTSNSDVQLIGRVDRLGYTPETFETVRHTYGALGFVGLHNERALGLGPTVLPSATGSARDVNATLQLVNSLSTKTWLHDTRTSLSIRDQRTTPAFALPAGSVRVTSTDADAGGIASLSFAGNDRLSADGTRLTWETTQESQVYATPGTRHRVKLYAQTRFDASTQRGTPNANGGYGYNSLEDLAAGRPSSFSRTLVQPERKGGAFNGALGVGSIYRTSQNFSLQYGVRVEANQFLTSPDANAALATSLGVRTNVRPGDFGVSPRVGFRWVYAKSKYEGGNMMTFAGRLNTETRGALRGGIGEFRGYIDPETIAGPYANTGLAGSTLRLFCVGAAIPTPDWSAFTTSPSSIPSACANGAPTLADRAPGVRTLDPSYRPPRSWRTNVTWATRAFGTDIDVEGIASLNLAQPSSINANFSGVSRFSLANEAARPVFVNASSIVGATGAIAALESRRDTAFGGVLVAGSQARSTSTQLRITLTPNIPKLEAVRLSWVGARVRSRENGFDRSTAGDPRVQEWASGDLDTRHQVVASAAVRFPYGFNVSLFVNATSGMPYTPIVSGDINGDGVGGNDRAFVTRGTAADPAFAQAMTTLLAAAPSRARQCLTSTMESIASRSACRGPWTATLNMQLGLPAAWTRLPKYTQLSVFVENPLAGADRLLHGNALRGWGTAAMPDPVLYSVRGFDANTRRFQYDVNPRFGSTDPRLSTLRAPFAVTVEFQVPVSKPLPQQQLQRSLKPGRNGARGPRRTVEAMTALYKRNVPDLYATILEERDSLLITAPQVAALEAAQKIYRAKADSIWKDLATYLSALGDTYDSKEALQRQEDATDAVWTLTRDEALALDAILTPQQLKLLPFPASYLRGMKKGEKVKIRMFFG